MKLAEALLLRSEYQKKIESLKQRILVNVKVQENEEPFENPKDLLNEIFKIEEQLCDLVKKINHNNFKIKLPSGESLADAIANRNMILKKISMLKSIPERVNEKDYRLTHTEVKMHVTLNISEIQKQIDSLSKSYRELDTQIQGVNWTSDFD
ncbi:MAG: DIP1984 family protein [Oscillospiraceae bacterium]|nr:DIP1984 family protein [Oscillospiraceae bacterium]